MVKEILHLSAALCMVLIALVSCSNEDTLPVQEGGGEVSMQEMRLSLNGRSLIFSEQLCEISQTRALSYNKQNSTFSDNLNAGLFVVMDQDYQSIAAGGGNVTNIYNKYNNLKITNISAGVKTDSTIYYPYGIRDTTTIKPYVSVLAYAPYKKDVTLGSMTFSVMADQTSDEAVLASDLLIGDTTHFKRDTLTRDIKMHHALTKVSLIMYDTLENVSTTGATMEVFIDSVATTGTIRLAGYNPDNTVCTAKDSVKMYAATYDGATSTVISSDTISAIIFPSQVPNLHFTIRLYGATLRGYADTDPRVSLITDGVGNILFRDYHLYPTFTDNTKPLLQAQHYIFQFGTSDKSKNLHAAKTLTSQDIPLLAKKTLWKD